MAIKKVSLVGDVCLCHVKWNTPCYGNTTPCSCRPLVVPTPPVKLAVPTCVSDTSPEEEGGYILSPNTTSLESGFDASFDVFISENAGDEGWGCSSSTQRTTKPPLRAERLLRARQHLGTEQTRRQMASVVAKARLETATARLAEADVCHLPR